MEVDSRPSDAIALAVRAEVPIYVEEAVLDKAGILLDKETGQPISEEEKEGADSKKVSEDELRRMSAFRDFINTLDLDNLDKHKS
jgi:bifunctional DNase/RNase